MGFKLLNNSKQQLIEKIKNIIINYVNYADNAAIHNFSEILSNALHKDFSCLSSVFLNVEGTAIEKYIINQKIERFKEHVIYDEMSLSEIADKLNYSSVAHPSN